MYKRQDERRLAAGFESGAAVVWDLETGQDLAYLEGIYVTLDALGERLVAGDGASGLRVWQVEGAVVLEETPGARGRLSPDGNTLALTLETDVLLFDLGRGEVRADLLGHADVVEDLEFSSDGSQLWTASRDGTINVYDVEDGRLVARLVTFVDGTWAVVDEVGRFDASYGGEVDGLHWVFGEEIVHLEQLKDVYYEPGLLAALLGLSEEALREVTSIAEADIELAPAIEVLREPSPTDPTLEVKLVNQGGGIGAVAIYVNDREFYRDARPEGADPNAAELTVRVDVSKCLHYRPGWENTFNVVPSNADGDLKGRGGRVRVKGTQAAQQEDPRFFAVVAGVSDYAGKDIDLNFAAKDARAFGEAIRLAASRLFDEVSVQVLHDKEMPATRANVLAALEKLAEARHGDVVVLYFAGHGITADNEYFFLTQEADTLEFADGGARAAATLSGADLRQKILGQASTKVVLILDTCNAGKIIEGITGARGATAARARALDELKERAGTFVLAGSAAGTPSYESTPFGQGLLTYSLLFGMQGAALKEETKVDVQKLLDFAQEQVPKLASEVRGVQRPLIAVPKGQSFPIGRLEKADRAAIPLAKRRPVVLRTRFEVKDEQLLDDLELTAKVHEGLRAHCADPQTARFFFMDTTAMPGAYRMGGSYTVEGDKVVVDVVIRKEKEKVKEFTVEGSKSDLDRLVTDILRELAGAVG